MRHTDKRAASRAHFDRWARSYEHECVSQRLAELQGAALAELALGPGDRLLDVGCATGAAVRSAAATVASAAGVDLSPQMIARGRELAHDLPNVTLEEGDAQQLPFADGAFSAVLCTTSLHHYPDAARAVGEMARVLAPGGRVVIADAVADLALVSLADRVLRVLQASHVGLRSTDELAQLLVGAGLSVTRRRHLMRGVYVIVAAVKPA